MPNWISYPCSVVPGGQAIIPALRIRMSRRVSRERNSFAAAFTEGKEHRSHFIKDIFAAGTCLLMSWMAERALVSLRAER